MEAASRKTAEEVGERRWQVLERFLACRHSILSHKRVGVKGHRAKCHVCRVNIDNYSSRLIGCSPAIYSSHTFYSLQPEQKNINIWLYAIGISGGVLAKERSPVSPVSIVSTVSFLHSLFLENGKWKRTITSCMSVFEDVPRNVRGWLQWRRAASVGTEFNKGNR